MPGCNGLQTLSLQTPGSYIQTLSGRHKPRDGSDATVHYVNRLARTTRPPVDPWVRRRAYVIRHFAGRVDWPTEAADFAARVSAYFPDVEDWPDWSAGEILEWIVHDLALALERSAEPPSA